MAEAAVEMPVSRYFCHQCTQEINPVLPDYVCPRCQGGFIELLEPSEGNWTASAESDEELDPDTHFNEIWDDLIRRHDPAMFRRASGSGSSGEGAQRSGEANSSSEPSSSSAESRPWMPYSYDVRLRQPYTRPRLRGPRRLMSPEQVVQMMLTVASRASNVSNSGVPILLNLHGNPGDYAWGRGGLDAVITQLLNQLDGTGPPPLPKEKIDEIPDVQIVQEQVDIALQCTVCMEDFRVGETVKRLSCQHHFHEDCIIPWLKLHGTCPICRKLLNEDTSLEESEMNYDIFSSVSGAGSSSSAPDRNSGTSSFNTNGEASGQHSRNMMTLNLSDSTDSGDSGAATNPSNSSVYEFTDEYD